MEFAHDRQINLIIMPTHGYGMFRRFLLGSVTAKVLHDAECPVWTGVHLEESPSFDQIKFRRIMVAVDLCPAQALRALSWGSQMADRFGAEMMIAHAYPSLEGRTADYFDPEWPTHFAGAAHDEIARMQAKLGIHSEVLLQAGRCRSGSLQSRNAS